MSACDRWNTLARAKPLRLRHVFASGTFRMVRADVQNMFYAGENVIVSTRYGIVPSPEEPVQDLILIVRPEVFAGKSVEPGVSFSDVSRLSLFGVACCRTAAEFAATIQAGKRFRPQLSTITNLDGTVNAWEIIVGKTVTMRFEPSRRDANTPDLSRLMTVTYAVQVPFAGSISPFLENTP